MLDPNKPTFVIVESDIYEHVAIGPYPDSQTAWDAMNSADVVEVLVQESCTDCYTAQFPNDEAPDDKYDLYDVNLADPYFLADPDQIEFFRQLKATQDAAEAAKEK